MKKIITLLFFICLYRLGFAQWVNLDSIPQARASSASFSIGDTAYVVAGGGSCGCYLNTAFAYYRASNTWSPINTIANYPSGYGDSPVGFAIGDSGYVGLGATSGYRFSNSFYSYDPHTNTWSPSPSIPGPGVSSGVAFVINGKAYAGGGFTGYYIPENHFYVYDPSLGHWDTIAPCPAKGIAVNAVAFSLNGKGYVGTGGYMATGSNSWPPESDFWCYDPATNHWDSIAPYPGGVRMGCFAFTRCNKGYVGGGVSDAQQQMLQKDVWEFDPTSGPLGTWTRVADFAGYGVYRASYFEIGKNGYVCSGNFSPSGAGLWEYLPTFTPAFSADSTVCAGNPVTFTDTSNFCPTNWLWSFPGGNPNSSPLQTVTVVYDTAGTYDVTLTAFNGCDSATKTFTKYITVNAVGGALIITPASASVCTGTNVTLTVSGGTNITWSPGASLNKTTGDTVVAAPSVTTTYTATNGSANCISSQQVVVTIVPADTGGLVTALRDTICSGTKGILNLKGNNSNVLQWQSSPTKNNFANINGAAGNTLTTTPLSLSTCYRVMVGSGSCTAYSDTLCLYVPPVLTASFNFTVSGKTVTFNSDSSQGSIVSYSWAFGDGTSGTVKNPSHTYNKQDTTYNVCLTIYDGSNCSFTLCKDVPLFTGLATLPAQNTIKVYPNPVSDKLLIISNLLSVSNVVVMDLLGRVLFVTKATNNQTTIDVSSLPAGVYLIEVRSENGTVVKKFVKE